MTYEDWIAEYKEKKSFTVLGDGGNRKSLVGMCMGASRSMVEAFPELRRVRGYVGPAEGCESYDHWWCVDPDGNIVDPTKSQFFEPRYAWLAVYYKEFDESLAHTLPTGKCMNCGGTLYYKASFCNEACAREVHKEFGWEWPEGVELKYNPTDEEIMSGAKRIYEVF